MFTRSFGLRSGSRSEIQRQPPANNASAILISGCDACLRSVMTSSGGSDAMTAGSAADQAQLGARRVGMGAFRDAAGEARVAAGGDRRLHRGGHARRIARLGDGGVEE